MRDCTQPSCCAAAGRRSRRCSTLSSIYWRDLNSLQVIWPVYRLQEIVRRLCAASIYTVIAVGNGRHSQSARAQACIPCVRAWPVQVEVKPRRHKGTGSICRSVAVIRIMDEYRSRSARNCLAKAAELPDRSAARHHLPSFTSIQSANTIDGVAAARRPHAN